MKICIACQHRFDSFTWDCPSCRFNPPTTNDIPMFAPQLAETNDGFDPSFFTELAALEARHFWFRSRNRLIQWGLKRYFPNIADFLEIGCGTGFVLGGLEKKFADINLSGSEIYQDGLHWAQKRLKKTKLLQMDAKKIPFVNEFDVIGAFDVLEHIKEDEEVLSQMHQALKKDGGILLSVPQHQFLWSQFDEHSHHVRRYDVKELTGKIKNAGFTILRITSFVSLLMPSLLIKRLRKPKPDYDVMLELKTNPSISTALEWILSLERLWIRSGINFPIGGSLLVIAKKA